MRLQRRPDNAYAKAVSSSNKGNFKPGNQFGKLSKRPKMPAEIKKAKRISTCDFIEALDLYAHQPYGDIVKLQGDTSLPAIDHVIISLIQYAAEGQIKHTQYLLDRLIGPIPKPREIEEEPPHLKKVFGYDKITPQEVTEHIDILKKELSGK